jgi:hypothetical protein
MVLTKYAWAKIVCMVVEEDAEDRVRNEESHARREENRVKVEREEEVAVVVAAVNLEKIIFKSN